MIKPISLILAICTGCILVLGGCGPKDNQVSNGVKQMLDTTGQLSKAIKSGDQAKIKETGPKLEDQWSLFEDDVKKDHKDLYEKVEKYLDPTIAGTEAPAIDKNALKQLNNQLTAALKELEASEK